MSHITFCTNCKSKILDKVKEKKDGKRKKKDFAD